jgi:anthranilate/para-aminobenzoate synthase component II
MALFPRTTVGGLSVSRMIIGTNWFLGWSHTTAAKDAYIKENIKDTKRIADIIEVYFRAGVDTIMGQIQYPPLADAIKEAEQRTGTKAIIVSTPGLPVSPKTLVEGFEASDEVKRILDKEAAMGAAICMPHQSITDAVCDRVSRSLRGMDGICRMIRQRGMIPGLSTHMPESITYADETNLDVQTYIAIFNAMGFLMQIEVDWVARQIREAKKPVMTIKPFAAGQIRPLQGLTFVWNAIREIDMVTVGTMSPREAQECVEMSLAILDRRQVDVQLQETRSKASVKRQK